MFNRQNKSALVTGASSGIGKLIARQLIADGFQVFVAARQTDKMQDLASVGARVLRMDISRDEEIQQAVDTILYQVVVIEPGMIETSFGSVVVDGPLKRSGSGAYEKLKRAVTQAMQQSYGKGNRTDPAAIARVVSKAVMAKRPKTRYIIGKYAMPLILIRKWFGDRVFDRILMSQMS
jgi:short subunit dehydrogenase